MIDVILSEHHIMCVYVCVCVYNKVANQQCASCLGSPHSEQSSDYELSSSILISKVSLIAKHLSVGLVIVQCSQFVCQYVFIYVFTV